MAWKQQISRRTLLKGLGTAIALPMLESMAPAEVLDRGALGPQAPGLFLCAQRHPHGGMDSEIARGQLCDPVHPRTIGAVAERLPRSERAYTGQGAGAWRRRRRSCPRNVHFPHRPPPAQDPRRRFARRRHCGPGGGAKGRPPDPFPISGARLRPRTALGQLRQRLQLRLFRQHLLAI